LRAAAKTNVHLHRRLRLGVRPGNDVADIVIAQHVARTDDHDGLHLELLPSESNDDANTSGQVRAAIHRSLPAACRKACANLAKIQLVIASAAT
jgi:hypothetical protein